MLGLVGWFASSAFAADDAISMQPPDDYQLVWADEFNAEHLDTMAWNVEINGKGNGNNELQYYTDRADNVCIGIEPQTGESCLVITAKREDYLGKGFTSGRINTAGKVAFARGKVVSRIKFPKTKNGLWPAFWLLGNNYKSQGWPRCGEIDIVEMGNSEGIYNGTQDRFFNGACHWGYYKNGNYPNYAKSTANRYPLQDGEFHTFTLEWDHDNINMYLDQERFPDAKPYYRLGVDDIATDWSTGRYFQHDFFILFNLAVGGNFTGILNPDDISALPDGGEAKMYVDWVRVYQKLDDINAVVPNVNMATDKLLESAFNKK